MSNDNKNKLFERHLSNALLDFVNHVNKNGGYDVICEQLNFDPWDDDEFEFMPGHEEAAIAAQDEAEAKTFEKKVRDLLKYIPKFVPNESWGNPRSIDRQSVDALFHWVRTDAAKGTTGPERVAIAFQKIMSLQADVERATQSVGGKSRFQAMGGILRKLIMLESLRHMMESYTDSAAGFVFEGFLAALLGGKQHVDKVEGELLITDVTGFAVGEGMEGKSVEISLKLLSGGKPDESKPGKLTKAIDIHGSYKNMITQLNDPTKGYIVYLIAYKDYVADKEGAQSLSLGLFQIDRNNFFDIFYETGQAKKLMMTKQENLFKMLTDEEEVIRPLREAILNLDMPIFKALKAEYERIFNSGSQPSAQTTTPADSDSPPPANRSYRRLSEDVTKEFADEIEIEDEDSDAAEEEPAQETPDSEATAEETPAEAPTPLEQWKEAVRTILTGESGWKDTGKPLTIQSEVLFRSLYANAPDGGMMPGQPGADYWDAVIYPLLERSREKVEVDPDKELTDAQKQKTQWSITKDYYDSFSGYRWSRGQGLTGELPFQTYKTATGADAALSSKAALERYLKSLEAAGDTKKMSDVMTKLGYTGTEEDKKKWFTQAGNLRGKFATGVVQYNEQDWLMPREQVQPRYGYISIGTLQINETKIREIATFYAKNITNEIVDAFRLLAGMTINTNQYFQQTNRTSAAAKASAAAEGANKFETTARGEFGFGKDNIKDST